MGCITIPPRPNSPRRIKASLAKLLLLLLLPPPPMPPRRQRQNGPAALPPPPPLGTGRAPGRRPRGPAATQAWTSPGGGCRKRFGRAGDARVSAGRGDLPVSRLGSEAQVARPWCPPTRVLGPAHAQSVAGAEIGLPGRRRRGRARLGRASYCYII